MIRNTLGAMTMAKGEDGTPGSLLDRKPKTDLGATLEKIEGSPVIVESFETVTRNGRDDDGNAEEYDVLVFTISGAGDLTKVHTSSKPIRDYFGGVTTDMLPATVTFGKVRSTSNPSRSYWDIIA